MGNIYLMTTIVDRKIVKKYLELYRENELYVMFLSLGYGTASNDVLDYLGLDSIEKAVAVQVAEHDPGFYLCRLTMTAEWRNICNSYHQSTHFCGCFLLYVIFIRCIISTI